MKLVTMMKRAARQTGNFFDRTNSKHRTTKGQLLCVVVRTVVEFASHTPLTRVRARCEPSAIKKAQQKAFAFLDHGVERRNSNGGSGHGSRSEPSNVIEKSP